MLGGQQAAADRFFKRHAVFIHSSLGGSDVMLRESTAHHGLGRIEYLTVAGSVPGQHFSQRTETDADLIPGLRIKKQQGTPGWAGPGHFSVGDYGYQRDDPDTGYDSPGVQPHAKPDCHVVLIARNKKTLRKVLCFKGKENQNAEKECVVEIRYDDLVGESQLVRFTRCCLSSL